MRRLLAALLLLCACFSIDAATVGKTAPDGTTAQADLPGEFWTKNTASKGLGNCVWTSIHHAGIYQDIPAVQNMPKWLIQKGIPGGGYPGKADKLIPQIAKERGYPTPEYIQVEGPWSKVRDVLILAAKTNRLICITYSRSPSKRYNGQVISHMVNMSAAGAGPSHLYAYLDNNYVTPPGEAYEWCSEKEANWASSGPGNQGVWAIIFLAPGPAPEPDLEDIAPDPEF